MARPGQPVPLLMIGLLLLLLGGAWASVEAESALPRFVLLAAVLLLALFAVRQAAEIRMLFVQARAFSEPGPTTTLLLAALVVFLGALLAARWVRPVDLTAERLNSLSRASRAVLEVVPGTLRLEGFYAQPSAQADRARRYLDLYARSSGRIETGFYDPDREPARAQAARISRTGLVVITHGEARTEVLDLSEEALTQGILRVIEGRPRRVGFLQGHGEPRPDSGGEEGITAWMQELAGANLRGVPFSLLETDSVAPGIDALVLFHPQHPLYPRETALLRDYLNDGGRLGIWIDPGDTTGLEEYLEFLHLRLLPGTIRDRGRVTAGLGFGPWVPALVGDPAHPITQGLGSFAVGSGVRPLQIVTPHPMDLTAAPILKTTGPVEVFIDPTRAGEGPLMRGVAVTGVILAWHVAVGEAWQRGPQADGLPPRRPEARVVVFGDSDFVTNRLLGRGANRALAVSALHWLTDQERYLEIGRERVRPAGLRLDRRGLRWLLYGVEFGLPLMFALLGLWVWARRRGGGI
ncbi:MAG: GldG family protein [Candidatus Eisenbacteria sp.]|nr:GldG family protein [Candidatus Eisenbacteria bacterium]